MIKTIELFGGIGTTNMAFSKIFGKNNVETISYVEWDEKSVNQFNAIHRTNFGPCDVQRVRGQDIDITHNGIDIFAMTISSPCQSNSSANSSKNPKEHGIEPGRNDESSLIWEAVRIVEEMFERDPINKSHMPHYIITENVPGIHWKRFDNDKWFPTMAEVFNKLGYDCYSQDVNGKDIGEAQMRNRNFLVCVLRGCGLPAYKPYEKSKGDPIAERTAKLNEIFSATTRQEIDDEKKQKRRKNDRENIILADFGKDPDSLKDFPYLVNPTNRNKKYTPVANNPYFCIVETSHQKENGKEFCKIYTDRVPTLCCCQDSIKVVDTYHNVYRNLTAKEAWLLQGYSVTDYEKAKATGASYSSLHKVAGDAILLNAFKQVIQQIPTEADPTDCYADNKTQNGDLKESREKIYRLAFETYNRIHKTNKEIVLPKDELAEFGRETDSKKRLRKEKKAEDYIVQERMWRDCLPPKAAATTVKPVATVKPTVSVKPKIKVTVTSKARKQLHVTNSTDKTNLCYLRRQISRGVNKHLILDIALLLTKENPAFDNFYTSQIAYQATKITLCYAGMVWNSKRNPNYNLAQNWIEFEKKITKVALSKTDKEKLHMCKIASLKLNKHVYEKYSQEDIRRYYSSMAA